MRKLTREEWIAKASAVHNNKYDYSKVDYINLGTPVTIICPVHGEFIQSPRDHYTGHGCPLCGGNKKSSVDAFIEKARNVHGDLYDYSKVQYSNNKTPVTIICKEHGEFQQTPDKHVNSKQGCPLCAKNHKDTKESFIRKARLVHGDLYDYSKVEYVDSMTKVCIIDPIYGEFWQRPDSHLLGKGCFARRIEKTEESCRERFGTDNAMQNPDIAKKSFDNKITTNVYNKSLCEDALYGMLINRFSEQDVVRQYYSNVYKHHCDFYICSRNMYIELNAHWSHGHHWYGDGLNDEAVVIDYQNKQSSAYNTTIDVWTNIDVKKRHDAAVNNLNYVVFWMDNLYDVELWFALGCPDGHDWDRIYSWLPNIEIQNTYGLNLKDNTVSDVMRHFQFNVFFDTELKLWQVGHCYHEYDIRGYMYANRFHYIGKKPDELSSNEILRGFKIAGIHRGYTLFDNKLMLSVLNDYDIKSVYDPCAGWGERLLTCYLHNVEYLGVDINKSLEQGYYNMLQYFNMEHQNFVCDDSSVYNVEQHYDAVITCPPYHNIEIYSENGAENLDLSDFKKWWQNVVKCSVKLKPMYFCFQINSKNRRWMLDIVKQYDYDLVDEYVFLNNKSSHFTRQFGGVNLKKSTETMVVLQCRNP